MHKVFVIILTFNSEKTIVKLLDSALPLRSRFKFIVVDNNSVDRTIEKLQKYKWAKIIRNDENVGFSAGNNIGIKYAFSKKADVVFLLNPDTVLDKNFSVNFYKSTKKILEKKEVRIVGPKIFDSAGKIWSLGGKIDKKRYSSILVKNKQKDLDYISGTAMFIKKQVFEKIGYFREDYFLYYEDVDFCQRAKREGFGLEIDPHISITHFESSSVGKNSSSMQYYLARNHMLFVKRFAPVKIKVREFIRLPKTIAQIKSRYELFGILDYFLRRFGKNAYWN